MKKKLLYTIIALCALVFILLIINITPWFQQVKQPPSQDNSMQNTQNQILNKHSFNSRDNKKTLNPAKKQAQQKSQTVRLLFLQSPYPCENCDKIKKLTKIALQGQFSHEKSKYIFSYQIINTGLDKNAYLIKEYSIKRSELILQKMNNKRVQEWKTLWKVYWFLDKPQQFKKYIITEIKNYLPANKKP